MATAPSDGFVRCLRTSVTNHLSKANHQLFDLMFENSVLTAKLEEKNELATYGKQQVKSTQPKSLELDSWRPVDQAIKWEQEDNLPQDLNEEGKRAAEDLGVELKAVKEESLEIKKQPEAKLVLTTDRGSQCDIKNPTASIVHEKAESSVGIIPNILEVEGAHSSPSPSVTQLFQELEEWGIFNEQRWAEGDNVDFGKFASLQEGLHSLILKGRSPTM